MRKGRFWLFLSLIVFLAALLRLYHFDDRFLFTSDTTRDLLVAKGAIFLNQLPWVGSFSSAGPFVFGPNYYWFLMFTLIIFPHVFLAPWLMLFLISLVFVIVMGLVGRAIYGVRFGLLLALVTGVSPMAIGLATYLTQHTLVEIFSGLVILGLAAYARKRKLIFVFLSAFGVGNAIAMHYQGISLVFFLLLFYLLQKPNVGQFIKLSLTMFVGVALPLVPLFLWDGSRGFRNLSQLIYYFRVGQYRFVVSDRWLTYLGVFWPDFLGKMLGGNYLMGVLAGLGSTILFGLFTINKKIPKVMIFIAGVLMVQVLMLRYFRGERFEGYLVYFHPTIILLLGMGLMFLVKLKRKVGFVVIALFLLGSIYSYGKYWPYSNEMSKLVAIRRTVVDRYGRIKVALYGKSETANVSYGLSYLLATSAMEDDNGLAVGVCRFVVEGCGAHEAVEIAKTTFQGDPIILADLSSVPTKTLTKQNRWYQFTMLAVHDDVQNWWRKGL